MQTRQLRDKATEALARGRFSRAAELYEEYCKLDPRDFQARVRLGDAWAKAGHQQRAIHSYRAAAEGFAREGFLPRAIAASKLILELDPAHQGVQRMLADLYARHRMHTGSGVHRTIPPRPSAAPEASGPTAHAQPQPEPSVQDTPEPRLDAPVEAAPSAGSQATPRMPPGLQPRRAPDARPPRPEVSAPSAPEPRPIPAASPPLDAPSLDDEELLPPSAASRGPSLPRFEIEADSILQAVEMAALAALGQPTPTPESSLDDDGGIEIILEDGSPSDSPSLDALPKVPLFSDLPPEAFIALFERCPLRRFAEGERIIEQGSRGEAFYILCEGSVRVVREDGAERKELAVLHEGAFFGEMALLSGAPRTASVVSASEDTQVLELSAPVLGELSRGHPQVARALKKFCRQRLLSNVMATSPLFRPFGPRDRRELVERFRARDVRRGDLLIREGTQADGLYVVLSGEVEVRKGGQHLALLREGELFGEMSLLHKEPASATVAATRHTTLLRLPREDFDTLILTHPQILALVAELTDGRRRHTEALLAREATLPEEDVVLL